MRLPLMLRLVCSLGLFSSASTVAYAVGVPSPQNSTTDRVVVGNASGTPMGGSPAGYDVIVRDINNAPVPGAIVTLDFSATGIRLYRTQSAGTTINCLARTISRVSNGVGAVNFAARIGRFDNTNSVEVSANGVTLAFVPGRSTDIDGAGGRRAFRTSCCSRRTTTPPPKKLTTTSTA